MFALNGFCSFERDISSLYWQRLCSVMAHYSVKDNADDVFFGDGKCVLSSSYKYGFSKMDNLYCVFAGRMVNFKVLKKQLEEISKNPCRTFADAFLILYKTKGVRGASLAFGEFSAVIYDLTKEKVFLFSDKAGCFPLYYICRNKDLVFSSAIESLFRFPGVYPIINEKTLFSMFSSPCKANPFYTQFCNIKKVPAGCCVIFSKEEITMKSYFVLNPGDKFNTFYLARDAMRQRGGKEFVCQDNLKDFELLMYALKNVDFTASVYYMPIFSFVGMLEKTKGK